MATHQGHGEPDDQLTMVELVGLTGLQLATLHSYRTRRKLPQPDGVLAGTPWWYRSTVETWMAERRAGRAR